MSEDVAKEAEASDVPELLDQAIADIVAKDRTIELQAAQLAAFGFIEKVLHVGAYLKPNMGSVAGENLVEKLKHRAKVIRRISGHK